MIFRSHMVFLVFKVYGGLGSLLVRTSEVEMLVILVSLAQSVDNEQFLELWLKCSLVLRSDQGHGLAMSGANFGSASSNV